MNGQTSILFNASLTFFIFITILSFGFCEVPCPPTELKVCPDPNIELFKKIVKKAQCGELAQKLSLHCRKRPDFERDTSILNEIYKIMDNCLEAGLKGRRYSSFKKGLLAEKNYKNFAFFTFLADSNFIKIPNRNAKGTMITGIYEKKLGFQLNHEAMRTPFFRSRDYDYSRLGGGYDPRADEGPFISITPYRSRYVSYISRTTGEIIEERTYVTESSYIDRSGPYRYLEQTRRNFLFHIMGQDPRGEYSHVQGHPGHYSSGGQIDWSDSQNTAQFKKDFLNELVQLKERLSIGDLKDPRLRILDFAIRTLKKDKFQMDRKDWPKVLEKLGEFYKGTKKSYPLDNLCKNFKKAHHLYKQYERDNQEENEQIKSIAAHFLLNLMLLTTPADKIEKAIDENPMLTKILKSGEHLHRYYMIPNYIKEKLKKYYLSKSKEKINEFLKQQRSRGIRYNDLDGQSLHVTLTATGRYVLGSLTLQAGENKINHIKRKLGLSIPRSYSTFGTGQTEYQAYISTKLGANYTFEILIPDKCETGDYGSYCPSLGTFKDDDPKNLDSFKIYNKEDTGWYYDIKVKDPKTGKEKKVRKYNGFYDRGGYRYDKQANLTKITLRTKKAGRVTLFLKIKCGGKIRLIEINIPPGAKSPNKVNRSKAIKYDELDQDGVRRGIFVAGDDTRDVDQITNFLVRQKKFVCKRNPNKYIDCAGEILKELAKRGKGEVDYLIRNVHANGFDHNAGAFRVARECVRYICTKKIGNVLHEVFAYGREVLLNASPPPHYQIEVDYKEFFKALSKGKRKTEFIMGNYSCVSVGKSGYELRHIKKNAHKIFYIATNKMSEWYAFFIHMKIDVAVATLDLLTGPEKLSYREIRKRYSVFNKQDVLTPERPDYVATLQDAMEQHNLKENVSVSFIRLEIDIDKLKKQKHLPLHILESGKAKFLKLVKSHKLRKKDVSHLLPLFDAYKRVRKNGFVDFNKDSSLVESIMKSQNNEMLAIMGSSLGHCNSYKDCKVQIDVLSKLIYMAPPFNLKEIMDNLVASYLKMSKKRGKKDLKLSDKLVSIIANYSSVIPNHLDLLKKFDKKVLKANLQAIIQATLLGPSVKKMKGLFKLFPNNPLVLKTLSTVLKDKKAHSDTKAIVVYQLSKETKRDVVELMKKTQMHRAQRTTVLSLLLRMDGKKILKNKKAVRYFVDEAIASIEERKNVSGAMLVLFQIREKMLPYLPKIYKLAKAKDKKVIGPVLSWGVKRLVKELQPDIKKYMARLKNKKEVDQYQKILGWALKKRGQK